MNSQTAQRILTYMEYGYFLDSYTRQMYMSLCTYNNRLRTFGVWQLWVNRALDGRFQAVAQITEVFQQAYEWSSNGLWRLFVDAAAVSLLLGNILFVLSNWNEQLKKFWVKKAGKVLLYLFSDCHLL